MHGYISLKQIISYREKEKENLFQEWADAD